MTGPALKDLARADLTYGEVGGTRGDLPTGYQHLRRSRKVGVGVDCFRDASSTLLEWEMHRRAGVSVRASSESVTEGAVAVLRLGWGPLGVNAPVRVVYVIDEEHRKGFAYGTLPGHPESGEEAFVVELRDAVRWNSPSAPSRDRPPGWRVPGARSPAPSSAGPRTGTCAPLTAACIGPEGSVESTSEDFRQRAPEILRCSALCDPPTVQASSTVSRSPH